MKSMFGEKQGMRLSETGFEHVLLVITAFLLCLGIVMVYSATVHSSVEGNIDAAWKQIVLVGISAAAMMVCIYVSPDLLRKLATPMLIGAFVLMLVVLLWGVTIGKSRRWLDLFLFTFQPGELAKLCFIIWLAHQVSKKSENLRSFVYGLLPYLLAALCFVVLFMFQPDFGSTLFLVALMFFILFVAGMPVKNTLVIAVATLCFVAISVVTNPMRMGRILAYLDPENPDVSASFHVINALTAIASNGLTGAGLGNSRQSISGLLPQAQSDFIFSIIAEELGFLGVLTVIASYLFILYRGTIVAARSKDPFLRYLAFGLTAMIVLQAGINIGGNCKLLPIKGLPLPFVSQGGSNLVTVCCALGLILNISRRSSIPEEVVEREDSEVAEGSAAQVITLQRGEE